MTSTLALNGVRHVYRNGSVSKTVLKNISCAFESGRTYAITGPSGAGKTTLLSLLAGLDSPSGGEVRFRGTELRELGMERYRRRHATTIFQDYNLLDYLTPLENVTTGMELSLTEKARRSARAQDLLTHLGIAPEDQRRATTRLSGGQQQRVAVARALASEVDVILADEPTGSLDAENAQIVMASLHALARDHGCCVIVVTHSADVARACDVTLRLHRGELTRR